MPWQHCVLPVRCGSARGGVAMCPAEAMTARVAFTVLSDATDAYEWSFVAAPAQREAGVVKHYDSSKGDKTVTRTMYARPCKTAKAL